MIQKTNLTKFCDETKHQLFDFTNRCDMTQWVSYVEQELLPLPERPSSPVFSGDHV
jgi:hypothetical protein